MSTKITYVDAQANLDQLCNQVVQTGEAAIITRQDGKNVVLISEAELESLIETLYLLRSPANATRLLTALNRAKARTIQPQTISELYKKFGLDDREDTTDEIAAAS